MRLGHTWRILSEYSDGTKMPFTANGCLDEVWLDKWFGLERLNETQWWLRVGDARIVVTVAPDGSAEHVAIERDEY